MIGKIGLALTIATLASCGIVQQRLAPVVTRSIAVAKVAEVEPADAYPRYNYGYSIKDALTGDAKSQYETRDGENVQGEYSIVEPDGTLRVVTYTAGAEGFNAVINRKAGFAAAIPFIESKPIITPVQNTIPAASFVHQQKVVVPVQQHHKVQFIQQQPQVIVQQQQPIVIQEPQPVFVEQQQQPIPVQQQPQPIPVQQQPQPIPVEQQPPPIPVQEQPQPIPVEQQPQPIPVQQQPQPIPVQQQPQPIPVQQPQPIPVQQQPRPQPVPVQQPAPTQQPQQQFQPRPQPLPQPQPALVQHDQQDPNQADDSPAIVVEASGRSARAQPRLASANPGPGSRQGSGSSFTYSSSGREYDFNISY